MNDAVTTSQITPRGLELADRLEQLLQLPLNGVSDPEPWLEACGELSLWIDANFSKSSSEIPQYLMFFFHDPDIRAKDPEYRNHQEEQVSRFIRQLRGLEQSDIKRPQ